MSLIPNIENNFDVDNPRRSDGDSNDALSECDPESDYKSEDAPVEDEELVNQRCVSSWLAGWLSLIDAGVLVI